MMGGGFTGQLDPRQIMMMLQQQRQAMPRPGGAPFDASGQGGAAMGMRSPNAPIQQPPMPQQQQPQNPVGGMSLPMLMAALKQRQQQPMKPGQNEQAVNQAIPPGMADPMAQGAAQAGDQSGGMMGWLSRIFGGGMSI